MKIAIIGMAGRFPGASNITELWAMLKEGKDAISTFSPPLIKAPYFVPKRGVLTDMECFDAAFFSYSPKEAELIDPQQRLFLECTYHAIEDAGYNPKECPGSVGVFAGCNQNTYLLFHVLANDEVLSQTHGLAMHADKDFLATRVSYKLNLQGPSMTIQTACSSSLVCVHQACQSLLSMECDMALAGGASIVFPNTGYFYQKGGVFSPDGKCRPFDHKAEGTLGSDGIGVVLLKRLEDALRDQDPIHAVILASAVNNDGSFKPSFAAPSIDGQAKVIEEALQVANIDSDAIGYIEGHGTGTLLGDAIELSALNSVFADNKLLYLGSLKSNIGHLDQASGIAGLIKTVLILKHGVIPPTLYFEAFHRDIKNPPFIVNNTLQRWENGKTPRRAGVSSFGFGGTNAHVILEEAPPQNNTRPRRPLYPFAKTKYFIPARPLHIIESQPLATTYERPQLSTLFIQPQSEIEKILVKVWTKHLGIQEIGAEDDFFDLGGHSLLATQIIASVKEYYPIELEIHEILECANIRKLADLIEQKLIQVVTEMPEDKVEALLKKL